MTVGIDLGTTYSAIATVGPDGHSYVIPNAEGEVLTPSVVLIRDRNVVVGKNAKNKSAIYPLDICQLIKRKMGDKRPVFIDSENEQYTPEEMSAFILKQLKDNAESYCKQPVTDAVITVPACFDDTRRTATIQAGEIAGLNILGVINEPTAAAIAYCHDQMKQDEIVMVFDLGGGTFDVSVLHIYDYLKKSDVLATKGNTQLGGSDFDARIFAKVSSVYQRLHGKDIFDDDEAVQQLRISIEEAKKKLSFETEAIVSAKGRNKSVETRITRSEFEKMLSPYLEDMKETMIQALDDAGLSWEDVSKVLLVGGSTRIPAVREMIRRVSGIEPSCELPPDEAVALGAAFYAKMLNNEDTATQSDVWDIKDVNSHNLGMIAVDEDDKDKKEKAFTIIKRNSPLPVSGERNFHTLQQNQTKLRVRIYEGDFDEPELNAIIGNMLYPLTPRPAGSPINVGMQVDRNGIIHVSVKDKVDGREIGEFSINRESNLTVAEVSEKKQRMSDIRMGSREDLLEQMVGLAQVKREVETIRKKVLYDTMREKNGYTTEMRSVYHFVFSGNPGTGKTTVARVIGSFFREAGILEKGQLVEVDRSGLVAEYVGQTAVKTMNAVKSALGGVLFIDEAYSLCRDEKDDFGREAIDTLVKAMEDHRNEFIVILAGYQDQMREFLGSNPGLESRITKVVDFPDYTTDELTQIARNIAAENQYHMTPDAERAFRDQIEKKRINERFGNARTARQIMQSAFEEKARRYDPDHIQGDYFSVLQAEDFGYRSGEDEKERINGHLAELDGIVGLSEVKKMIQSAVMTASYLKKETEAGRESGTGLPRNMHLCFSGNPGTGKTTMARIYASLLSDAGILQTGNVYEATRADFVAGYQGQTAMKTAAVCERAYGGVLFIDEAYTLCQGESDSFGLEAVAALIKEMEDHRDKLVVIFAGYSGEMEKFFAVNPGIRSRLYAVIEFPDYDTDELTQIFYIIAKERNIAISADAEEKIHQMISDMHAGRDENFGNARDIRNLFERIWQNMVVRVETQHLEGEERRTIIGEDVL